MQETKTSGAMVAPTPRSLKQVTAHAQGSQARYIRPPGTHATVPSGRWYFVNAFSVPPADARQTKMVSRVELEMNWCIAHALSARPKATSCLSLDIPSTWEHATHTCGPS